MAITNKMNMNKKTVNTQKNMKKEKAMNIIIKKNSVIVNKIEFPTGIFQEVPEYMHGDKGTRCAWGETWGGISPRRFPEKALYKLIQLAFSEEDRRLSIVYGHKHRVNAEGIPYTPYCVGGRPVLNNQGKWYLDKEIPPHHEEEAFHKIMVTSEKGDTQIIVRHRDDAAYYIMREYDYVPYVVRQVKAEDFPSVWKRLRKAGYVQQSCSWSDAMAQGAIVDYHNGVARRKDVNEQLRIQLPGLFR